METTEQWVGRVVQLIRMVSELHRMGYQQARIMPYEYPLAFRLVIAPRSRFSRVNGALVSDGSDELCARYSSAAGGEYFGWTDAANDDARQLAEKWIVRFPELALACRGSDWTYAGWLADLLATLERKPGRLPIVVAEYLEPLPELMTALPLRRYGPRDDTGSPRDAYFPLPPAPV